MLVYGRLVGAVTTALDEMQSIDRKSALTQENAPDHSDHDVLYNLAI